jgi:hypothetical protein
MAAPELPIIALAAARPATSAALDNLDVSICLQLLLALCSLVELHALRQRLNAPRHWLTAPRHWRHERLHQKLLMPFPTLWLFSK